MGRAVGTTTTGTTGRCTSPTRCRRPVPEQLAHGRDSRRKRRRTRPASSKGGARVRSHARQPRINQRNFGRPPVPRSRTSAIARSQLIRTLQDHTTNLGVTVYLEHTVIELLPRRRSRGGAWVRPRARALPHLCRQGGHPGDRGRRARLQDHEQQLGGTGDGHALAYRPAPS